MRRDGTRRIYGQRCRHHGGLRIVYRTSRRVFGSSYATISVDDGGMRQWVVVMLLSFHAIVWRCPIDAREVRRLVAEDDEGQFLEFKPSEERPGSWQHCRLPLPTPTAARSSMASSNLASASFLMRKPQPMHDTLKGFLQPRTARRWLQSISPYLALSSHLQVHVKRRIATSL